MATKGPFAPSDADLSRCVHCGLCLQHCPTYTETGLEAESPRGRLYLIRAIAEERIEATPGTLAHLDLCLQCRNCEAVCPSGVPYGRIMESARAGVLAGGRAPLAWRLRALFLRQVIARPSRMAMLAALLRLYRASGLRALAERLPYLGERILLAPTVSGRRFKRPDVPAFAADDPSLHLVVREVHERYRGLGHIIARIALNGHTDDVLGLLVRLFFGLVLDPFNGFGRFVLGFVLHRDHELALGFLRRHVRDLLEHLPLIAETFLVAFFLFKRDLLAGRKFPFAPHGICFPLFDAIDLFFEVLFLLGQPPFLVLKFLAFVAVLTLDVRPRLVELVLGFEQRLLELGLRFALRVRDDPRGLCLCITDLPGGHLSFDQQAQADPRAQSYKQ